MRHLVFLVSTVVVLGIDQISKLVAGKNGVPITNNGHILLGQVAIPSVYFWVSAVLIGGLFIAGIIISRSRGSALLWLGLGLMLGGSVSNLADRLVFGYVRDFIPILTVVNPADIGLTAGAVISAFEIITRHT